ncbi:hypothetical protein E4U42_004948 [Claviceps africana]|uniref:BZIP domain-containing protein n=1 Tax=Claviceps africana TaxID=83212 RepID=A0A8K0J4A1_9HYPO|nr:hypothetical protein E4U42_004948 [Claviceps africana]
MLTANFPTGPTPDAKPDTGGSLTLIAERDSFFDSPGRCLFGDDTMDLTYPDPPSGFLDQFTGSGSTDLYSFHPAFSSMPESSSPTARVSNASEQPASEAPASSKTQPKPATQPSKQAKSKKTSGKPKDAIENEESNATSKPHRQSKRESARSAKTDEAKKPTRRERSLERNRVAASKCRKRKKAWTEKLEEKKSGLEAMHSELQSQYLSLLEESSHLKNHLITHAGCHDPNIDVWINNEASKYVRRLSGENFHRPSSMQSLPSLDNNSVWHSSGNSHYTGLSEGSPTMEGDDSNEEDALKVDFDDDFGEEMFG